MLSPCHACPFFQGVLCGWLTKPLTLDPTDFPVQIVLPPLQELYLLHLLCGFVFGFLIKVDVFLSSLTLGVYCCTCILIFMPVHMYYLTCWGMSYVNTGTFHILFEIPSH